MSWFLERIWAVYSRRAALRSFYPQSGWLIAARSATGLTSLGVIAWLISTLWLDTAGGLPTLGYITLGLLLPTLGLNLAAALAGSAAYRRYFVLVPGTLLASSAAGFAIAALSAGPRPSPLILLLAMALCLYACACWYKIITVDYLPGVEAGLMR